MSTQGAEVYNLIKIDSATTALHMREKKTGFGLGFFANISILHHVKYTAHIFRVIWTLNGSNDLFPQPLVPSGSGDEIAPQLGG